MRARRDVEVDAFKNRMSARPHADRTGLDSNAFSRNRDGCGGGDCQSRWTEVRRTERLQHPQNRAPICWILPCDERQFVSERRQIQEPVNLEKETRAAAGAELCQKNPRHETETHDHLKAFS